MTDDEFEKKEAKKLLDEHAKFKGPGDLENWKIRARTFLVFAAMKRIGHAKELIVTLREQK